MTNTRGRQTPGHNVLFLAEYGIEVFLPRCSSKCWNLPQPDLTLYYSFANTCMVVTKELSAWHASWLNANYDLPN